jgi:CheY-like chemotaxis protein
VNFDPIEAIFGLDETFFSRHRRPSFQFNIVTEPEQPILYFGDPHCFLRIVAALLSNGAKFTPTGRIVVRTAQENDRSLVLTVTDNGCGMERPVLESIQRHFLRPDTAVIYEDSRVGVGLSMVTEMVRVCGATIAIDSAVGVGTTVRVAFPWAPVLYPWFPRRRAPIPGVLLPYDDCDYQMTLAFAAFYGLAIEVVTDRAELLKRPKAEILLVDVPNREMGEWLSRALAKSAQHQIVACLSDIEFPRFSRTVEWFARPLRLNLLRTYFARVALRRISNRTKFHVADEPIPTDLGLRVLAVDDNTTNQLVITKMLQKLGCTFQLASNGREAVDAVRREYFDVVLLDQFMPEMDGPDAARAIRALDGDAAHVPIVAMTASNLQNDEKDCRDAGMDGFLTKPASLRTLARVLESWRGRRAPADHA